MKLTPTLFAASFFAVLAAAGSPAHALETEYTCTGQEQTRAYFVGDDPASATPREYPLTIDFHLRSGTVMFKSASVALESSDGDVVHFGAKSKTFWINGQFSKSDGKLSVVDERTLEIAGRTQRVRTTGQYVCKK